jgi:predicted methyltransferase
LNSPYDAFAWFYAALKPGGVFVFDLNSAEALRGRFDAATNIGGTDITMFRLLES